MYSPNFSKIAAVTVRRLSWAMGSTMGLAVDVMVKALPAYVNAEMICPKCLDHQCFDCAFHNSGDMPLKALPLLYGQGNSL